VSDSNDEAPGKPYVNVLHDYLYRVEPGTREATAWLEENAPEFNYDSEGFMNLDHREFPALLEKLEAAGIAVHHWNASGFPLGSGEGEYHHDEIDDPDEDEDEDEHDEDEDDEDDEDDEGTSEEPEADKPPASKPWPPGRSVISPQDVLGDEWDEHQG
jgi:hypothetical protein